MIEHPKLCKRARARCLKYNLYVDIATKFNPITMKFAEEKKKIRATLLTIIFDRYA